MCPQNALSGINLMRPPVVRVWISNMKESCGTFSSGGRGWGAVLGRCCCPPRRPPSELPPHQGGRRSGRGKEANQIALGLSSISGWFVGFNFPSFSFSKTLDSYSLIFSGAPLISPHLAISKLGITAIPWGLAERICRYLTITVRLSFFLSLNFTSKLNLIFYGSAQINFLLIVSCLRREETGLQCFGIVALESISLNDCLLSWKNMSHSKVWREKKRKKEWDIF